MTKGDDNGQLVGSHGEGSKLAALVMCRNGYGVQYTTTSQHWNFCFRGKEDASEFCCNISGIKKGKINKDMRQTILKY